jgi:glycine/D-amino acid oxidase-like deaminating enzyme
VKIYEVAIVGRGVTGLSTANNLIAKGIQDLVLIGPDPKKMQGTAFGAHYAQISLHDNITRPAHNIGSHAAKALLQLNRLGYFELTKILPPIKFKISDGETARVASSEHEAAEMMKAVDWLSGNGFPARLATVGPHHVQYDGSGSMIFNPEDLQAALSEFSNVNLDVEHTEVEIVDSKRDFIELRLTDGKVVRAQMVVLACHLGIKKLLPVTEPVFINHADQCVILKSEKPFNYFSKGDVIFTMHSQFWMALKDSCTVVAGGARFLRKWAGIDAKEATVLPVVTERIALKCAETLGVARLKVQSTHGFIDLRSCDELPVIGPLFGESRILIAGGYMGSGITMGLAAGIGIAELIATGKSRAIDSIFFPSRFRSLPDSAN